MASKSSKNTGLGNPDIPGADGLFNTSGPTASEPSTPKTVSQSKSKASTEAEEDRIKTSLSLSQETIDLLNLLKPKARKQEGRFVSFGILIDRAIKDLANKMDVKYE